MPHFGEKKNFKCTARITQPVSKLAAGTVVSICKIVAHILVGEGGVVDKRKEYNLDKLD